MKKQYLIIDKSEIEPFGIVSEILKHHDHIVIESDMTLEQIREKINDKNDQDTDSKRPVHR